jgi:hypothetical protein
VAAPAIDEVELDDVVMTYELSELATDFEAIADADENAAYPGGDLVPEPVAVEDATEPAATENPVEPVRAMSIIESSHTPARSSTWFAAAVSETSDPVPQVERSIPLCVPTSRREFVAVIESVRCAVPSGRRSLAGWTEWADAAELSEVPKFGVEFDDRGDRRWYPPARSCLVVIEPSSDALPLSSSGRGRHPFKVETGVQFPLGAPICF